MLKNKVIKLVFVILLFLIYFKFSVTAIKFFAADSANTKAKGYLYSGQVTSAMPYSQLATNLNSSEPSYQRLFATLLIAEALTGDHTLAEKTILKKAALIHLNIAYTLQKANIVNLKSLIPVYYFLTVDDVDSNAPTNHQLKEATLSFYKSIENASPNDASFLLILGKHYRLIGENLKAKELLERALTLKPDLKEAHDEILLIRT